MEERFRIEREISTKTGESIRDYDEVMHLANNQEYKDYIFDKYIVTKRIIGFGDDSVKDATGNLAKIKTSITFYSKADYDEFESDDGISHQVEGGLALVFPLTATAVVGGAIVAAAGGAAAVG